MAGGYVVAADAVRPRRTDGDTAAVRETIGAASGCDVLEQLVLDFAPGRSAPRATGECEEVLYVLRGAGSVLVGDEEHAVEADTGLYVAPGQDYAVDHPGPDDLRLVAVRLPGAEDRGGPRCTVMRLADQEAGAATADREFRLLADPTTGCRSATQFVGVIPPGRAPEHYHHYDEVIYVLRGEGVLHLAEGSTPVGPGSCIHLPRLLRHSLENAGQAPLEVLGVFRPAGSPSEAYYPDGTPAMSDGGGETPR
jgi:mannose-6-phosphate isomerase-like protein (cupin superfamily)